MPKKIERHDRHYKHGQGDFIEAFYVDFSSNFFLSFNVFHISKIENKYNRANRCCSLHVVPKNKCGECVIHGVFIVFCPFYLRLKSVTQRPETFCVPDE